ncbi:Cbb3-type cytochrome c oxidase subunit [Kordiimonas sediminis]|uniref:Cbb3-type cytochrome c oxidase subunit n=1 Tax=Kordiimonas sediminis TaxID=1735581 RepID=A0A919AQA2_9PROT|nr:cytochrome-c oxidase, cbb3-type subunit III [Kordiimonas sediminis]GHF19545.1 Cbb3-type cytochrome c oxidase subunit [Kordiimonas sediminis]
MSKIERDEHTGTETTGHEWDGIKELNTPLPKWWLYTFYACILWSIGYMVVYPAIPFAGENGYSEGTFGYSQRDVVAEEVAQAKAAQSQYLDQIAAKDFEEIRGDQDLMAFAAQGGKAAFGDNCAPCHGTGAQGFTGFPNLNDDDWIWGGTLSDIYQTIKHGIRWDEDDETRFSEMPRFLDDGLLERSQVEDVTEYVLSLSGNSSSPEKVERGAVIFAEQCTVCHGESGMGDRMQGAPNLTDAIWLYGGEREDVYSTIAHSRRGVMPSWAGRLDDATIKQLVLYVHGLGGGEQTIADEAEDFAEEMADEPVEDEAAQQ